MLGLMSLVTGFYVIGRVIEQTWWSGALDILFIASYLPWFVLGMAAFEVWRDRLYIGVMLASTSCVLIYLLSWVSAADANILVALGIGAMFLAAMYWKPAERLFSMRWLTAVGVSSYSLYLLHQYAGLTLIAKLADLLQLSGTAAVPVAVLMALLMIALAYCIYRAWEQPLNRIIVRTYMEWRSRLVGRRQADRIVA